MNLSNTMVPIQILASQYRTTTHDTESHLRNILRKFISTKNMNNLQKEPIMKMLSQGKQEILSLKRKLSQKFQEQYRLYDNCKKRIHRHEQLKADAEEKKKFELKAQIVQYLHCKMELEKAKKLEEALKEESMFQLETNLLEKAVMISQAILDRNYEPLKKWMYENKHNLDKNQSSIYFELASCEYLELINKKESVKACFFLRQKLKGLKLTKNQHKILQKLTYLLIDPQSQSINQKDFIQGLQSTFKRSFSDIYLITFDSSLQKNLVVGISALKTICCCKSETQNAEICPICCERTNKLSQKIPMLTKESSTLKCRINQSIMNEENYPLALPSGNIYSVSGLNETSKGEYYFCMNTETWYPKSQAKKVFLA